MSESFEVRSFVVEPGATYDVSIGEGGCSLSPRDTDEEDDDV